MAVQITINKLQVALTIAATMIPTRSPWFQVDPKNMFMSILKGTNKVQLLNMAWKCYNFSLSYLQRFANLDLISQYGPDTSTTSYDFSISTATAWLLTLICMT